MNLQNMLEMTQRKAQEQNMSYPHTTLGSLSVTLSVAILQL